MSGSLLRSTTFRLGVLGARWESSFAAAIAADGLKPKHVALLAVVRDASPSTQQELAASMGVTPSLVVALATELEARDAIRRERDPDDRRRQRLALTLVGHELLERSEAVMSALDQRMTERLGPLAIGLELALDELDNLAQGPGASDASAPRSRAATRPTAGSA